MVCHVSSYHRQSDSPSHTQTFLHPHRIASFCTLFSRSPIRLLSSPGCSLSSRRQMRSRRQRGSLGGLCPHIVATPTFNRLYPRPCALLHLMLFLSDSWQPVGYSGHCQTCRPLPSFTLLHHHQPAANICQMTCRKGLQKERKENLNKSCLCHGHCSHIAGGSFRYSLHA